MGNEGIELVTASKASEKKTLLEKYDIPIEHLSYEHISSCTDSKELERIVLILRSGEEGVYPDLTIHAVDRLAALKPGSKVLRVEEPIITRAMLEPEERKEIDNDIDKWMNEMQNREKDLEGGKALQASEPIPYPEIRQVTELPDKKTTKSGQRRSQTKRLESCDYAGWDKYDADTELERMDLQYEQSQIKAKKIQQKQREVDQKSTKFSQESIVKELSLTATELSILAEKEKDKGNEAFRAGDYKEALQRYNASIAMEASVSAHNNRAITYIKLQRYEDAVNDCNSVLWMEYTNVKALLRRGLALEHLEKKSQALVDYESVLKLEPNSKTAISAVQRLRKSSDSKKVRMKIEESTNNRNKVEISEQEPKRQPTISTHDDSNLDALQNRLQKICFCDRAPGPSQHSRPLPHMKSSYCFPPSHDSPLKKSSRSTNPTKQHSIYTDNKMPGHVAKPSGVIIEELPSETKSYETATDSNKNVGNFTEVEQIGTEANNNKNIEVWNTLPCEEHSCETIGDGKTVGDTVENFTEIKQIETEANNNKNMEVWKTLPREEHSCETIGDGKTIGDIDDVKDIEESCRMGDNNQKIDVWKMIPSEINSCETIDDNKTAEDIGGVEQNKDICGVADGNKDIKVWKSLPSVVNSYETIADGKTVGDIVEFEHSEESWTIGDNSRKIEEGKTPKMSEVKLFPNNINNAKQSGKEKEKGPMGEESGMREILTTTKLEVPSKNDELVCRMDFNVIETPYEFLRTWQSFKYDTDLSLHAQLLRSLAPEDFDKGNKLDGTMLSVILRCLERYFCKADDAQLVNRILHSFSRLSRFSIVSMFLDTNDKKALKKIFTFLEEQRLTPLQTLRNVYNI